MFDGPGQRRRPLVNLIIWLPTFIAVAGLVGALAFVGLRAFGGNESVGLLPAPVQPYPPAATASLEPPPSAPASSAAAVPVDRPSPSRPAAGPTGGRPPALSRPPLTRPPATVRPPSPVTGSYRVLNSYGDAFIAEVLITNRAGQDLNWTVGLRFPGTVGELITSWVESAPQATLTAAGQTYTWRSGVPVAAGSSASLRFHFQRSGTGNFPVSCTVNGSPCAIRR